MRLTFVITNAPPLVGGLEKVCLRLAQQFQREGHEVRILGRFAKSRHDMPGLFRDTEKPGAIDCEGVRVEVLTLNAKARLLLAPMFKLIWRRWAFPVARMLYVCAMRSQITEACRGSDVVHYFGVGREMLGFAAAAAAKQNSAVFCVDPAIHPGKWGDFWIDAELFKRADRMFCYSEVERTVLERLGVAPAAIKKVPCGFDFVDTGNAEAFKRKHALHGPIVLFLGRKTIEKGVGRLLAAWPRVADKFSEATLVFAGPREGKDEALKRLKGGKLKAEKGSVEDSRLELANGSLQLAGGEERIADGRWQVAGGEVDRRQLAGGSLQLAGGEERKMEKLKGGKLKAEKMADSEWQMADSEKRESAASENPRSAIRDPLSSEVEPRVIDLDDLSETEKQDALAACDVLCVPSEGESFGMVYFEAWAYGKPVVALDLPVLRETVGAAKAGILVKNDPHDIAQGIIALLGDGELRTRLGANGRKLALGHKWEEAARHYLRGYEDAMKTRTL